MNSSAAPELILIGGGGHCAACIDVIEAAGQFRIAGIIDSNPQLRQVCGYPVLGNDSLLGALRNQISHAFVTLGQLRDVSLRMRLTELIVMHDALVNARAIVGSHCIINSKALIEHDAIIDDFCHISTAAVINGGTHIHRGTFFGSNAVSKEMAVSIKNDFIKAGSIFTGLKND